MSQVRSLSALVVISLVGTLAACARSSAPKFGAVERVNATTDVGTAPVLASSNTGAEAAAWVSAPNGGSDGRLYVRVNGGGAAELQDSLGSIEPHGEAPPRQEAWLTLSSQALHVGDILVAA